MPRDMGPRKQSHVVIEHWSGGVNGFGRIGAVVLQGDRGRGLTFAKKQYVRN